MNEIPSDSGIIVARNPNGTFQKGHIKIGGREEGKKNYDTEMEEAIKAYAKLNHKTPEEIKLLIYMRGVGGALQEEYNFFRDFMDRKHGKPLQREEIDHTTQGEKISSINYILPNGNSNDKTNSEATQSLPSSEKSFG